MKAAREILDLLSTRERRHLYLLIAASAVTALLQVVGIASIMPFLAVVTDPSAALENAWLDQLYRVLNFESTNGFLIFLGFAVFGAMAVSNGATALTAWFTYRFSFMLGHNLSTSLLEDYLFRPYDFFLNRNSSELSTKILSEIWEVVHGVVLPGIKIVASGITALFIVALLLVVDPLLAIAATVVLGGLYAGIFVLVRGKLTSLGRTRVRENRKRFQEANEAFGGIKEVKLLGKEQAYLDRFAKPSRKWAKAQSATKVISSVPTYALELIAFGGIILIVIYLLAVGDNLAGILPLIGLYAFATYRLKPALQQIFTSAATIRNGIASLDTIYPDLRLSRQRKSLDRASIPPLSLNQKLELRNIHFSYPGAGAPLFENFDIEIDANTSVAFVGSTGSGKTTLADILMGLLSPAEGQIVIDGEVLDAERLLGWQNSIGYVPQHIYLSDISVAGNIAFGVHSAKIDMAAVERAAVIADIHEFIVEKLPHGYDTVVGERGVRLSGGQRQRIGIARALYHDPEVLILDEATSALDGVTEQSVFAAVDTVRNAKTVIMIAHRLSTVRDCDVVHLLEHGRIVAQGTYDELLATNPTFRTMALGSEDTVKTKSAPQEARA